MQNAEVFRRGVVVPLDDLALVCLRANNVDESQAVKCASIADEDDFTWLWEQQFFAFITKKTGVLLDDYEEDELPPVAARVVSALATEYAARGDAPESVKRFCGALAEVCQIAMDRGYPLFFIL